MKTTLLFLSILFSSCLYSQNNNITHPVFPGCETDSDMSNCFQKKLYEHIGNELKKMGNDDNESGGRVYVSFTIDKNGLVKDIKIRMSPDIQITKKAEQIFSSLPKMKPALEGNIPVERTYTIPLTFIKPGVKTPVETSK